jgi:hypothetical protein
LLLHGWTQPKTVTLLSTYPSLILKGRRTSISFKDLESCSVTKCFVCCVWTQNCRTSAVSVLWRRKRAELNLTLLPSTCHKQELASCFQDDGWGMRTKQLLSPRNYIITPPVLLNGPIKSHLVQYCASSKVKLNSTTKAKCQDSLCGPPLFQTYIFSILKTINSKRFFSFRFSEI